MKEWSEILNIKYETIKYRIKKGYSIEKILFVGKLKIRKH